MDALEQRLSGIFGGTAIIALFLLLALNGASAISGASPVITALSGVLAVVLFIAVGLWFGNAIVFGWRDFARFSVYRIWAISSVSWREAVRRRVLWITPLAMLGIIAVTQLAHPFDEQDAIRQATKYCLFATGVIVILVTIIMACTSLPKEIDNRVIYTIVTKPATRLEIVLGKTVGFARVSGAILLIMGLFSYAYLSLDAARLRAGARTKLATLSARDPARETLQHYADEGLLKARSYGMPEDIQVYARPPQPGDPYTWAAGNGEQNVLYPFLVPAKVLETEGASITFAVEAAYKQRTLTPREIREFMPGSATRPTSQPVTGGAPRISISLLGEEQFTWIASQDLISAIDDKGKPTRNANMLDLLPKPGAKDVGVANALVILNGDFIQRASGYQRHDGMVRLYVSIMPLTMGTDFGFKLDSVSIRALVPENNQLVEAPVGRTTKDGRPLAPVFRGRMSSTYAQQIRGDQNRENAPVGVYSFRKVDVSGASASVPCEFRVRIERNTDFAEADDPTRIELVAINSKSGHKSPPLVITPDVDRPSFFTLEKKALEGGNFDLHVRSLSDGHHVNLRPRSIYVIASNQSFGFNLLKSIFILWMMAILVVIISIFCSTFVSWPIAVVLTLVILLGRWAVQQLGEPATAQQIITDMMPGADPTVARLGSKTLEGLNRLLLVVSKVLPDTSKFSATEHIERGITIPGGVILDSALVLILFGLPLLMISYVFLKNKEVAP